MMADFDYLYDGQYVGKCVNEEGKEKREASMRVFEKKVLSQTRGKMTKLTQGMNERVDIDDADKTNKKRDIRDVTMQTRASHH